MTITVPSHASAVIIGGGVVGINATKMALGLGCRVTLLDVSAERLAYLDDIFGQQITTLMSNPDTIGQSVARSDLVIGGVLVTGAKSPILVSKAMIQQMQPGSVVVDVAIDQGGCIETIKPTTHDDPTYEVDGVVHYGVTNIPGDVPQTSTYALTNVTLPYAIALADHGYEQALATVSGLVDGLNTLNGEVTYQAVAMACGLPYSEYRV